ncbi:MAG: hypothetical protein ABH863_02140 [Candidatus Micrarchaeota archaeon]
MREKFEVQHSAGMLHLNEVRAMLKPHFGTYTPNSGTLRKLLFALNVPSSSTRIGEANYDGFRPPKNLAELLRPHVLTAESAKWLTLTQLRHKIRRIPGRPLGATFLTNGELLIAVREVGVPHVNPDLREHHSKAKVMPPTDDQISMLQTKAMKLRKPEK